MDGVNYVEGASAKPASTREEPSRAAEATLAERALARRAKSNARLTKLFTALTLLVGVFVVGVVAYNIYLHPAAPRPVGTAIIKISGTALFSGEVGTLNRYGTHTIKGTAPVRVEVPYGRADYVSANMERSSGAVEICVKPETRQKDGCKTVAKSSESDALVMWKAPR
jgi:hypothetical protein